MSLTSAILKESMPGVIRRRGVGTYSDDGKFTPAAPQDTPARIVLQPVTGTTLKDVPEGLRDETSVVGWVCLPELETNVEIIMAGVTYRVLHTWPRPMDKFTKFAAGRVM